jgi:hypothetical protein
MVSRHIQALIVMAGKQISQNLAEGYSRWITGLKKNATFGATEIAEG